MSKNIVVDFLVNKFGEYKIGWFSAYDTLKGMVALYGADKVQEALTEIVGENAQQSRALDAALPPAKDDVYKIEWLDGDTVRLTPSQ